VRPAIRLMRFDAAWLMGHYCSSITSPAGVRSYVLTEGPDYPHAHAYLAMSVLGRAPKNAQDGAAMVIELIGRGYLRVAHLPTVLGMTVGVEGLAIHRKRMQSIVDLAGDRYVIAAIWDGMSQHQFQANEVWAWASDSGVAFETALAQYERSRNASA